jgi:hypothetical protein
MDPAVSMRVRGMERVLRELRCDSVFEGGAGSGFLALGFVLVPVGRVEDVLASAFAHAFERLFLPVAVLFLEKMNDHFGSFHARPRM